MKKTLPLFLLLFFAAGCGCMYLLTLLKMDEFPQLLFRMGYARPKSHTPRRMLEENSK